MVYGHDLVRAQIEVARGNPLPFRQENLSPRGWAIECRLYAEDPDSGFLPDTGRLDVFRAPMGPGIRLDSGVVEGSIVGVHYDPMLAKLIAWGDSREEARQRLSWALSRFVVLGVRNNLSYLSRILNHPAFVAGETHTHFLTEHMTADLETDTLPDEVLLLAAASATSPAFNKRFNSNPRSMASMGPWTGLGPWRLGQ